MSERLAVIGASGFVGSALTEYALTHANLDVVPFCHSTGGATRLAHRKLSIRQLDLLDREQVEAALHGFEYVVNCSRGGKRLMLDGVANLLAACHKANVKQLVHLSSVAIYGDPPPPASTSEDASTTPEPGSYGAIKLAQDEMVQHAAASGLRAIILCPPNIIGPYSDYLTDIIRSIETGRFRYINAGQNPISIVDVNNLSACVLRALVAEIHDGRRLFACEPGAITWHQLCDELAPILRDHPTIAGIDADAVAKPATISAGGPARHRAGALKHLLSDDVRTALRLNPTWAAIEAKVKIGIRRLGKTTEEHLRTSLNGPIKVDIQRQEESIDRALIAQQLRMVRHDPSRCQRELGFQPPLTFAASMQSFRTWYRQHFEPHSAEWALLGTAAK